MNDDGHGPKYGCTYQKCGNPSAELPCPFVKDERLLEDAPETPGGDEPSHRHHYVLVCSCGDIKPITTSEVHHDIISVRNRGESWMD